jgi:heme-degrading monooxygenase HmoA
MHIQIVNFHLKGMTEPEFRAMSDELAPTFATVPGLISKTWLADADTNTYGGVYLWDNEASCRAYQASELFNAVKSHPNFADVASREFGVLDGPSKVTRAAGPALATT